MSRRKVVLSGCWVTIILSISGPLSPSMISCCKLQFHISNEQTASLLAPIQLHKAGLIYCTHTHAHLLHPHLARLRHAWASRGPSELRLWFYTTRRNTVKKHPTIDLFHIWWNLHPAARSKMHPELKNCLCELPSRKWAKKSLFSVLSNGRSTQKTKKKIVVGKTYE